MKITTCDVCKRLLGLFCVVLLLTICPHLRAQDEEREKKLELARELEMTSQIIVMLRAEFEGAAEFGAGIVVGRDKDRLFIITAYHVLHRGALHPVVRVKFMSSADKYLEAKLLKHDEALDLALISVENLSKEKVDPCKLRLARLGDQQELARGSGVFAIGNPNEVGWAYPIEPERITRIDGNEVVFQSTFIRRGHSGGALLDDSGHIIGMTTADEPPFARALKMEVLLEKVKQWGIPIQVSRVLEDGMTPLHVAARNGDLVEIRNLLTDCGPNVTDFNNDTPLHFAAGSQKSDAVILLLKAGADVNALNNDGWPPIQGTIETRDLETFKVLVRAGAKFDFDTYSALIQATRAGQPEMVAQLVKGGARLDATDGDTALHYAVFNDSVELVQLLLNAGAKIEMKGRSGRTPLHVAVMGRDKESSRIEIITILLKAGARGDSIDVKGNSPLHETVLYEDLDTLKLLLAKPINVDVHLADHGEEDRTALYLAATQRIHVFHIEIMQALLKAGANVNARMGEKRTALHGAVSADNLAAMRELLQAGADINARDINGDTPLLVAVSQGFNEPLKILLEAGADVNVKNSQGKTALQIAQLRNFTAANLLRQYGAK